MWRLSQRKCSPTLFIHSDAVIALLVEYGIEVLEERDTEMKNSPRNKSLDNLEMYEDDAN